MNVSGQSNEEKTNELFSLASTSYPGAHSHTPCVCLCVRLEFFKVLTFACLAWTDCDLLTFSPADIGSHDHQALQNLAGMPEGTLMRNIETHLHSCGQLSGKLLMASFSSLLLVLQ